MKCITKLIDKDENEINGAEDILKYEETFYKNLYTNTSNISRTEMDKAAKAFKDDSIPKISEESKNSCEKEITLEELGKALKQLKNGKSPGSDGFTSDFYKFFWIDIKDILLESIIYAKNIGKLSIDQRRGIINLIPKKDKDPRELKNWRPISLLNTDIK
jgi:hypothetical protein